MNKQLQIFQNNEFGQIRVVNKDGEPWFVAKDVCDILEIGNSRMAIERLSENMKGVSSIDTLGGRQEMNTVSEAGLYKLVFTSRKLEAERFTDWVATDVIPSIRKTGAYSIPTMTQAELTAMIAQNQVEIERKANQALEHSERTEKRLDSALNALASPPDKEWRQSMNSRLRGMCEQYQLNYPTFFGGLYTELEAVARVNLTERQKRHRNRMIANGATRTECKAVTKLEIIERDPKLKPIFEGIVRKYQAKYALDWQEGIQ